MADIELVIKMSEERYKDIQRIAEVQLESNHFKTAEQIIAKGTPLPKGHGKLIDAGELTRQLELVANDEWNKQVGSSKGLEDAIDIIEDTPTIIEAESEG